MSPEACADADDRDLRAEVKRLRSELEWVRERMGGFCPGSWEANIAARVGRALDTPAKEAKKT